MKTKCDNCGQYFDVECETNDNGDFLYWIYPNTSGCKVFCSYACQEGKQKKEQIEYEKRKKEWEKEWKIEKEKRERENKIYRCSWCGKTYRLSESTAISKSIYCCKRCAAHL